MFVNIDSNFKYFIYCFINLYENFQNFTALNFFLTTFTFPL